MIVLNIIIGMLILILSGIIFYIVGRIIDKITGLDNDINIGGSILLGIITTTFILTILMVANFLGELIIKSII